MQTNIPSSQEEVTEAVNSIVEYLQGNPYGAVEAEVAGTPCVVIAAVADQTMKDVQPLFIIPSPELILSIVDPEDKKPIFGVANPN